MSIDFARRSAVITHAHSLGQDGAACVAAATLAALHELSPAELLDTALSVSTQAELQGRFQTAKALLQRGHVEPARVASVLGNGISAAQSCSSSVLIAARHLDRPLSELLEFCRRMGGDVDTVGAMAAAIWGARNGLSRVPPEWLRQIEDPERLLRTGVLLFEAASERGAETRGLPRATPQRLSGLFGRP